MGIKEHQPETRPRRESFRWLAIGLLLSTAGAGVALLESYESPGLEKGIVFLGAVFAAGWCLGGIIEQAVARVIVRVVESHTIVQYAKNAETSSEQKKGSDAGGP